MRRPGFLAFLLLALPAAGQEAKPGLAPDEFARRRAALVDHLGGAAAALDAGPIGGIDRSGSGPMFDFKYLTGFHEEGALLVLAGGKAALFVADPAKVRTDIETVLEIGKLGEWAQKNLAGAPLIHTKLRQANLDALRKAVSGAELAGTRLGPAVARLRVIKSDAEIRLMRKAADATNAAHVAAMKTLKVGMNEKEIHELVVSTFRKEGCPDLGFPPICASGRNGTVLHYMKNDQPVPPDTLMVIDIGAAIENYVTDITRTLPTSGRFSEGQKKHYQCVLDAQKAAEALLRPGATFQDLSAAARRVFEERGLTKWSYAHAQDRSVRHGLGHYVGMYVHDSGASTERFAPGMVITIEPGWYDKDEGYGIRIEDAYLVTREGFDRLSAAVPREIDEIEKLMIK